MTPTTRLLGSSALALGLAFPLHAETIHVDRPDAAALQAALDAAAASSEDSVILIGETGARVALTEGLRYAGASGLTIFGNGLILATPANVTLLTIHDARSVHLAGIAFEGPGGWSIAARGDAEGAAGKGLFIDIAEDATGVVDIVLEDIAVTGVAGHGIHVSDCTLADACGGGEGGEGEGSDAGIALVLRDVTVTAAGTGRFDSDGLRIDERGPGGITLHGLFVAVEGVGADGIELDEGQEGDVDVRLFDSRFVENGAYCDPDLLAAFLPDTPEDEFEEGERQADAIPAAISGSPDDACVEREVDLYDDGSVEAYEFAIDVDDGFDIDEAGPGGLYAVIVGADMSRNLDEGFDFDEAGPGPIEVTFANIFAEGNADEAVKLTEEDDGDLIAQFSLVEAINNGGAGIFSEEAGTGDLSLVLSFVTTVGNDGGAKGIEAVQDNEGDGIVYLIDSEIADAIETDGAEIDPD